MKKVILTVRSCVCCDFSSMRMPHAASGTGDLAGNSGRRQCRATATDTFVKVSFTPKCSANVIWWITILEHLLWGWLRPRTKGKTFNGIQCGGSVGISCRRAALQRDAPGRGGYRRCGRPIELRFVAMASNMGAPSGAPVFFGDFDDISMLEFAAFRSQAPACADAASRRSSSLAC
jgi:hypothetical protein